MTLPTLTSVATSVRTSPGTSRMLERVVGGLLERAIDTVENWRARRERIPR